MIECKVCSSKDEWFIKKSNGNLVCFICNSEYVLVEKEEIDFLKDFYKQKSKKNNGYMTKERR